MTSPNLLRADKVLILVPSDCKSGLPQPLDLSWLPDERIIAADVLVGWLRFNVTFSDISAIKWRDSCPISKFRPAAGHPTPWAARVLYRVEPIPTRVPRRPKMSFTSLPLEDPQAVKVCRESNPDRPIHSTYRYLYATVAGRMPLYILDILLLSPNMFE